MRLSEYAVGRDNNFNLIRFLAALSVLFGHSIGVLGLPSAYEFFFDHLGLSLAEMAVDVFFVTSGFLVTASLINRGNLIAFLWARVLRIYPALWAMLTPTVFALAPARTIGPVSKPASCEAAGFSTGSGTATATGWVAPGNTGVAVGTLPFGVVFPVCGGDTGMPLGMAFPDAVSAGFN